MRLKEFGQKIYFDNEKYKNICFLRKIIIFGDKVIDKIYNLEFFV